MDSFRWELSGDTWDMSKLFFLQLHWNTMRTFERWHKWLAIAMKINKCKIGFEEDFLFDFNCFSHPALSFMADDDDDATSSGAISDWNSLWIFFNWSLHNPKVWELNTWNSIVTWKMHKILSWECCTFSSHQLLLLLSMKLETYIIKAITPSSKSKVVEE